MAKIRSGSKLVALIMLLLLALTAAACSGSSPDDTDDGSIEVAGPALVMFYTDN